MDRLTGVRSTKWIKVRFGVTVNGHGEWVGRRQNNWSHRRFGLQLLKPFCELVYLERHFREGAARCSEFLLLQSQNTLLLENSA